jgi:cytoskeleton protein RodZ
MTSDPLASNLSVPSANIPTTAGGLMRSARQAQGMHIAVLASTIKVTPRKLELLETDQFSQLPDATFTRALAQAVCRSLKIDAAPILALLPPPNGHRLEQVAEGLNTPFHDRPGRLVPREWANVANPALWLAGLIVLAAALVYWLPASWLVLPKTGVSGASSSSASGALNQAPNPATAASTVIELLPPVTQPTTEALPAAVMTAEPPAAAAVSVPKTLSSPRSNAR